MTDDEDTHADAVADVERLEAAKHDLANVIGQYADGWSTTEGSLVTKFIVIAEVYTPDDAGKALLVIESDDLQPWDRRGFLMSGLPK